MSAVPPVCHIPPATSVDQPGPVAIPAIPPATPNLASLVATVNAMRQVIIFITGQQGPAGPQGAAGGGAKTKPVRWTEESRSTEKVKIYNPDDNTQFVEIERINKLTMQDGVTGESWTWSR